jgi:hypothetical protein
MSTANRTAEDLYFSLDYALDCVEEFDEITHDYARTVTAYREGDATRDEVEECMADVEEAWESTDWVKQEIDVMIEDRDWSVDSGDIELAIDSIERYVHNSVQAEGFAAYTDAVQEIKDEEEPIGTAISHSRQEMARFNKQYLRSLDRIARLEPYTRDVFDTSPELLRIQRDPTYVPLEDRIRQQVELLREAAEEM